MAIYDDQEKIREMEEGLKGSDFDKASEKFNEATAGQAKNAASPEALKAAEGGPEDQLGKGYTGGSDKKGFGGRLGGALKGMSKRQKILAIAGMAGLIPGAAGLFGMFGFLNIFQLDHLLNNIEQRAFIRYQVDMDGRSSKWIAAYLALRLAEVEDPELRPRDRDNIIFRSNRVDNNNPLTDWYKTMRASRFEQDLLEKHGIKFASVGCRGTIVGGNCVPGGNVIRFRPAIIQIGDERLTFSPTDAEIRAIEDGDINSFNGRLRDFIQVEILSSDRVARNRLKAVIRAETKWYQVIKRYYVRKAIQNMTGIRDWRFFDLVGRATDDRITPDTLPEKRREIRNKFIAKAIPEGTKTGKFINCLFGLSVCKTTTDPNNPANKSTLAPLPTDGENVNAVDEEGNPVDNTHDAEDGLREGVNADGDSSTTFTRKLLLQVIGKISGPLSIISAVDTLNVIDKNIRSGALSNMVYMSRATQAIGIFTVMGIMRDQMRTGEVTAEEVDLVMDTTVDNAGNGEGWRTVVAPADGALVSAAPLETTTEKTTYCDPEFQETLVQEGNEEKAKEQYAFRCDSEKIGGDNLAQTIENGWNQSIGVILTPILLIYNGSGLSTVVGWVNSAAEFLLGPPIRAILSATGLDAVIENVVGWMSTKALAILGGGPMIHEAAPPAVKANHALMGAAAASEFSARNQGAPITNPESRARAEQSVAAFMDKKNKSKSLFERYLSLSSPDSVASQSLFAVANNGWQSTVSSVLGNLFNGSFFANSFLPKAGASNHDGYAAADFAGVETYDFPTNCVTEEGIPEDIIDNMDDVDPNNPIRNRDPLHMTPLSATNADDLGIIPAEELTWDLIGSSDRFNERLYQDENYDGEKNKQVYNCALLDSAIRGGLGAIYDDSTLDENSYGFGFNRNTSGLGTLSAADLKTSSVDTPCAAGTNDAGTTTGYTEGSPVEIRLCAIPGLPSSGQESQPGNSYSIGGANGFALVNSKVSANWLALVQAASAAGHTTAATSSFRTMAHQEDLCNANTQCSNGSYTFVAKPGTSNHQLGLAIDFAFPGGNNTSSCVDSGGVCTLPGSAFWIWLRDNSKTYGMSQYSAEYWHWDPEVLRQ
jgi:D-alanyl-D-alanine carboxypeptidase-like protein